MANPRKLSNKDDEKQYNNLKKVANVLTALSDEKLYLVRDCYFDYDQNWMWTTILCYDMEDDMNINSYQYLNPKRWEDILNAKSDLELLDIAKLLIEDKL